jgi:hypothetical protein
LRRALKRSPGLLLLLLGCAAPRPATPLAALTASSRSASGPFLLRYAPGDEQDALRIQRAAEEVLPRLEQWGHLREPITLQVMPDHASLEASVRQHGLDWLRAWGRYDDVFIQTPSTWGLAGATPPQLNELLLHELTHCLMYQLASDRLGWTRKQIPLWFREGMASYTAEQSYRWVSLEEIAKYLERFPESDPVRNPDLLYRDDSNLVYGVAHQAFVFLVRRYGEEAVRGVLREMKDGKNFPEAFAGVIGLSPEAFTRDFTRYVRWRGFRGGRLPPQPVAPAP